MLKTSMCDYEKLSVVICPIYSHFANLALFNCLTVRYILLQYSVACIYYWVLITFLSPFCILIEYSLISLEFFMQTKLLCVLIHIRAKGEVGTVNLVQALQLFYY